MGDMVLSQSLAILEYLEEAYPQAQPLLPKDSKSKAQVKKKSHWLFFCL